jgi:hypothetical protein
MHILRLNKAGIPTNWLSREEAATLYAKQLVLWSLGDDKLLMRGGHNRMGERSRLWLAPIIACDGDTRHHKFTPALSNLLLFRRDQNLCMYCGQAFSRLELTRDHIVPRSQGGRDSWTNVVSACKRCNLHKGGRTPEQANMQLLAVPFRPNVFEFMYLANHRIRGDQMEYLRSRFSGQRQWLEAAVSAA